MTTVRSSRAPASKRLYAFAAIFVLTAEVASFAHRRDEYLQAARLAIDPNLVTIELDLTPGIAVADRVISAIDADRSGSIDANEARAYSDDVRQAIAIDIDGAPLDLKLTGSAYPSIDGMRQGQGTIRLRWSAAISKLADGLHHLRYRNTHGRDIGVYLANTLVPANDRVIVTAQRRDADQHDLIVDYELHADTPTWRPLTMLPILVGGLVALTALFWRPHKSGEFWDALADSDPLWAILSDPSRRGRRWDLATFFRTGEREISTLMHQLTQLAGHESKIASNAALDFGCGVGRLTQALSKYFASVVGIDISEAMIAHARRLNQHGDRVTYLANTRPDLSAVEDRRFDLVYTDLVLQHMPPEQALGYVAEFIRVLRPGGFLVFQLPSHKRVELAPEIRPMPASAYKASIRATALPVDWPAKGSVRVDASVKNISSEVWNQRTFGALRLGNHWLAASGEMLVQDDGRAWMPEVLRPGEEVALVLEVSVPDAESAVVLELDLVHEGHSWFADKGSSTLRIPVARSIAQAPVVRSALADNESWSNDQLLPFLVPVPNDSEEVDFPMYGIHRDEVIAFVTSRGGELLHCESDDRGGREWVGYRYFFRVRRPG